MKESLFYDTRHEVDRDSWNWSERKMKQEIKDICTVLKIGNAKYHDQFVELLENATYGGHLVIYFLGDIENYNNVKGNRIMFKNPTVAVIDTQGGSGFDTFLKNIELEFEFYRNRLHRDIDTPYPYVTEVCGMVENWCDNTKVSFKLLGTPNIITGVKTILETEIDLNARYQRVFDAGGCTFGDMHINRHRNVHYTNDYTCGNKCKDCGTFWID